MASFPKRVCATKWMPYLPPRQSWAGVPSPGWQTQLLSGLPQLSAPGWRQWMKPMTTLQLSEILFHQGHCRPKGQGPHAWPEHSVSTPLSPGGTLFSCPFGHSRSLRQQTPSSSPRALSSGPLPWSSPQPQGLMDEKSPCPRGEPSAVGPEGGIGTQPDRIGGKFPEHGRGDCSPRREQLCGEQPGYWPSALIPHPPSPG